MADEKFGFQIVAQVYGVMGIVALIAGRLIYFGKTRTKQKTSYKDALLKMTGTNDVNAVGLLLEEVYHYDFALRQEIRAALTRLLPRLQAENAPALDEHQRKTLTYLPFVTGEVNQNLRLAALQAIAQVGNAETLRIVNKNRKSTGQEEQTELGSPVLKRQRPMKLIRRTEFAYVTYFQSAAKRLHRGNGSAVGAGKCGGYFASRLAVRRE